MGRVRTQLQGGDVLRTALLYATSGENCDDVESWWDVGPCEIAVKMKNGRKFIFDGFKHTVRSLVNPEDVSEEVFAGSLAKRMKRMMDIQNITQSELAEKIDVSKNTVNNYITGKTQPTAFVLFKIANVLNCDINELVYFY